MKVLVTGANGFIGSHLAETLAARGHQVRGLVRRTSDLRWLAGRDIRLVFGDVTLSETLAPAVAGVDAVFHLASTTRIVEAQACDRTNCGGTHNILEACRQASRPPRRFVLMSSQAAAGPSSHPRDEDEPSHPVSLYGESKLRSEELVLASKGRFTVVILRPPAVFGPRDEDAFEFFRLLAHGWRLRIGLKSRRTSICFTEDLIRACLLCLERPVASGSAYFIADPKARTWDEIFELAACVLGRKTLPLVVPPPLFWLFARWSERLAPRSPLTRDKAREMLAGDWVCSTRKAERELGFTARVSLEEGMRRTVGWYRTEGWL